MESSTRPIELIDYEPQMNFEEDVISGLQRSEKRLPCKYFYDKRGSELFDRICELPEYYPTRTELAIMKEHAAEMAESHGPDCLVIEYGSGSSLKTRILLESLEGTAAYVPVDISREHLLESSRALKEDFSDVEILPVCADFTQPFDPPEPQKPAARRVVYFPGSTLGNFTPNEVESFLKHVVDLVGEGGGLLVGLDLKKDEEVIEAAYNDSEGVTAAFNLNLLERINRELDGDFEMDAFSHQAIYNADEGRVEISLVSRSNQTARVGESEFSFEAGERILTEYSHKFDLEEFAELARTTGLEFERDWRDTSDYFSVALLEAR